MTLLVSFSAGANPALQRYIVLLKPGANPTAVAAAHGVPPTSVYEHAIRGFAADLAAPAIDGLTNNPNVLSITPVRNVTAFAQTVPTGVARMAADAGVGSGASVDVDVAIVDTGIVAGHADLNVVARTDCSGRRKTDTQCVNGAGSDGDGHGTHVAGTVAAIDNGIDVVGVAPGARLHAVKVLDDSGNGTTETIVKGLDWVAARASVIEVANMSLGGACTQGPWLAPCDNSPCSTTTDPEHKAICNVVAAGVTVVVAAGNSVRDSKYYSPAAYDEVITVSALADFDGAAGGLGSATYTFSSCTESLDDSLACFSNFGADVDLMAPGVGILSTTPSGLQTMSGTSMASPHVAGAAALYMAANPLATPAEVKAALIGAAEPSPCALTSPSGACSDDPDNVGEPLAYVGGPSCVLAADCNDGDACTTDACTSGACVHGPTCDDGNACTADTCDPLTAACGATPLGCDDANACTGVESCDPASGCVAGAAVVCNDANACTVDTCDPASGTCGASTVTCNDGSSCTTDSCSPASGCTYVDNGTCACKAKATSCSSNSECCSGSCRGGKCR